MPHISKLKLLHEQILGSLMSSFNNETSPHELLEM